MSKLVISACALFCAIGCGSSSKGDDAPPKNGGEGEACYPNGTCGGGLSCLSKLCVATNETGGTATGGAGVSGSTAGAGTESSAGTRTGGAGAAAGGTGGGPAAPECITRDVTNSTASEKLNAAFCVGIGFDDRFSCSFNTAANETRCIGATLAYVVVYMETDDGTVGDIYNLDTNAHVGVVIQAATGEFDITLDGGAAASCVISGDIARFCLG